MKNLEQMQQLLYRGNKDWLLLACLQKDFKITEEDFKNVVLETGFEFEGIKKVAKPIRNLKETEAFIKENPSVLILKTF